MRDHLRMFAWWGRAVVRRRWAVLAAGMVVAVIGALWGVAVFGQPRPGGRGAGRGARAPRRRRGHQLVRRPLAGAGRWYWWAPGPLGRIYSRYALRD